MDDDLNTSKTRIVTSAFSDRSESMEPGIFAISGPIRGATFDLGPGSTTIGRRPENTVQIPVAGVSKRHCTIDREKGGEFFITDHGSTNGTEVNGRRLREGVRQQLTDGDTIRILESTFFFLNPRGAADLSGVESIQVDFASASSEARDLLEGAAEAVQLRKARRRR